MGRRGVGAEGGGGWESCTTLLPPSTGAGRGGWEEGSSTSTHRPVREVRPEKTPSGREVRSLSNRRLWWRKGREVWRGEEEEGRERRSAQPQSKATQDPPASLGLTGSLCIQSNSIPHSLCCSMARYFLRHLFPRGGGGKQGQAMWHLLPNATAAST